MEDESDNPIQSEPNARQPRSSNNLTPAKRAALERTAQWREDKARTIWPPAPVGLIEPVAEKPVRKPSNPILVVISIVFVTLWAFLVGCTAGIGHKDFSESLTMNIGYGLFDLLLWSMPILYWFGVLRSLWRTLKAEPTMMKKIVFAASSAVLVTVYGSGLWISPWCLTVRAAYSDTIY